MKSTLLKHLTKYIILMIINAIIFFPWGYIIDVFDHQTFKNLDTFQTFGDYFVRLMTVLLLIIDFRKEKLPFMLLACVSSIFYPLLGIIIFSLLYLEKLKEKASA